MNATQHQLIIAEQSEKKAQPDDGVEDIRIETKMTRCPVEHRTKVINTCQEQISFVKCRLLSLHIGQCNQEQEADKTKAVHDLIELETMEAFRYENVDGGY